MMDAPGWFDYEEHLEKFIFEEWRRYFRFNRWCRQYRITNRAIVDLIGYDEDRRVLYVIELKIRAFRKKDIAQVERYKLAILEKSWVQDRFPMVVGILVNQTLLGLEVRIV